MTSKQRVSAAKSKSLNSLLDSVKARREKNEQQETMEMSSKANMRLKIARMSAGLTQKQLAEMCGVSDQAITRLEVGRVVSPDPEIKRRICEALCAAPFEIFDR